MVRSVVGVVCVLAVSLLSGPCAHAVSVDDALALPDSAAASIELAVVDRYVQDLSPNPALRQIPCGIKVIPQDDDVTATLKPGDLCDVSGTVVASSSSVAECYIDAVSVTKQELEEDVPPPLGMPNHATAGGEYGLQQALYRQDLQGTWREGSGLNTVGTLVRVWGRVQWIELADDHVTYWLEDGSRRLPIVAGDGQRVTRGGLKVIAWTDSATPVRYQDDDFRQDYVSFVGIVGAEFTDDPTPLPVPVVRVGRQRVRQIICVDGVNGDDRNGGSSWDFARRTVQAAIDDATVDDEIWVMSLGQNAYTPGALDAVATLKDGVALHGGFSGNEDRRWERDPSTHETILVGNGASVVRILGLSTTSRVDSFTVRYGAPGVDCVESESAVCNNKVELNLACLWNGNGISCTDSPCSILHNDIINNGSETSNSGGGISCSGGHPCAYIAENTISDNMAGGNNGGAIFVEDSSPVIRDNEITGNYHANWGGGLSLVYSDALIQGNTISGNESYGSGGGIWCSFSSPLIIDNEFEGNTSGNTGGGLHLSNQQARVLANTFTANNAACGGGAVSCDGSAALVSENTFTSNTSDTHGGAILCTGTGVQITRNEFETNTCDENGGAVYCWISLDTLIDENTFHSNESGIQGGAIMCDAPLSYCETGIAITRNTFDANNGGDRGGRYRCSTRR